MRSFSIAKLIRELADKLIWVGAALAIVGILAPSLSAAGLRTQVQQASSDNYTGVSVETSPQIFSVMCALDAAGFDADETTLVGMPERLALRADLLKMQGPAAQTLRDFYRQHALADPGETLSRFIAFALVVGPPPDFHFQMDPDVLPPDVLALDGFQEILVSFYKEAHLDVRWAKVEPEYQRAADRYDSPLSRTVMFSNAYLREVVHHSPYASFTIYVEPLAGARTTLLSFGDRYALVVGTREIPLDDIQQAYLHFLLDPLPVLYREKVKSKSTLLDIAAHAPRLPAVYQVDLLAFTGECLVRAVELRLRHLAPDQLEAVLRDDDESGFILVHPLFLQLQKYEKGELSMRDYFPQMIAGIDVEAERKRLQSVKFPPAGPSTPSKTDEASAGNAQSELKQLLAEGNNQIALQHGSAAAATFE